jgi:hypothetical protein
LTDPDGNEFYAYALCNDEDNYNKRIGVIMALKRAFELMTVCKSEGFSTCEA